MHQFLSHLFSILFEIIETIIIALAIFVVFYLFIFQPHEVIGSSMDGIANFKQGQYILTDKVTYKFREPKRGEVIVFKYPLNPKYDYIKRIIGLPGESIMLSKNKVYIFNEQNPNGFILDESEYLASNVKVEPKNFLSEGKKYEIPTDSYVVMGDNRTNSSDSREWGFLKKTEIIGRSYFRYIPVGMMGVIQTPKYHQ